MNDEAPDEVFFREWAGRGPAEHRSITRAREVAAALDVLGRGAPVLTVVGSKGKGTAATYASATLGAAGLRVCTVTSPGLRSNRERIRLDGEAISEAELRSLAKRVERAVEGLPEGRDGYLSPAGLFLLAGLLHARDAAADALVLEAGMGGRSDEVALFPADVVAITPVFGEHLGVLGDTPAEIAAEKAGVVSPGTTRAVLSAPQSGPVARALPAATEYATGTGLPSRLLPDGLTRPSAELGVAAASRLLDLRGLPRPSAERLGAVLSTVALPGRLSCHALPGTSTEVLADAAIDRTGVCAALTAAHARWGGIDHVLLCLPDHKDLEGAVAALAGLPVTYVRLPYDHLAFTRPLPPAWRVAGSEDLTRERVAGLGRRVLALGTVYFVGLVLDLADAPTGVTWTSRPASGSGA